MIAKTFPQSGFLYFCLLCCWYHKTFPQFVNFQSLSRYKISLQVCLLPKLSVFERCHAREHTHDVLGIGLRVSFVPVCVVHDSTASRAKHLPNLVALKSPKASMRFISSFIGFPSTARSSRHLLMSENFHISSVSAQLAQNFALQTN